jgi:hypothetical protein
MSIVCTVATPQPNLVSLLFVTNNVIAVGSSQRVVSRANLNVTCIASSTTLQPAVASVLLDEAFVVKFSVVDAAPPSVFPVLCELGLSLVYPLTALTPLSGSGLYEGIVVLKCRFASCLYCRLSHIVHLKSSPQECWCVFMRSRGQQQQCPVYCSLHVRSCSTFMTHPVHYVSFLPCDMLNTLHAGSQVTFNLSQSRCLLFVSIKFMSSLVSASLFLSLHQILSCQLFPNCRLCCP